MRQKRADSPVIPEQYSRMQGRNMRSEKGNHALVGDFYMIPLLHIYSDVAEENKRVLRINRRYYKKPLYIEVQSKALLKKSTIEEQLINLEAVNFTNGEEKRWTKIKEYMSRHFIRGGIKQNGRRIFTRCAARLFCVLSRRLCVLSRHCEE